MRLSKSIERQLSRIESTIAEREQPQETPRQRFERESAEAMRRHWQKYADCIFQMLDVMDADYHNIVVKELEAAPPENIRGVSQCHETGGVGLLPPLSSGVCRYARRLIHQEGLSYPIPCAMPASICQFLIEHGQEIFRHPETMPRGNGRWPDYVPQYAWLSGRIQCSQCYFPMPHKSPGMHRINFATFLDGPDTIEIPFKKCPHCGGTPMWVG
ncbi:hypothetical protein EON83_27725 [bacterium]|nr:MAG: hypothetical protein EON83_27725 [bacterium]